MSWNYRVCKTVENGETLFGIQEVFYDEQGKPMGFCDASVADWESVEELKATLHQMLQALDRPVIDDAPGAVVTTEVLRHGTDCPKVPHVGEGYGHDATMDGAYAIDGIAYCGRCHGWLGAALPFVAQV